MMVLLTSGAYSDYEVHGLYDVPSVQWLKDQFAEWLSNKPGELERHHHNESAWLERLTAHPECRQVEYHEVHMTSYGTASESDLYDDQLLAAKRKMS